MGGRRAFAIAVLVAACGGNKEQATGCPEGQEPFADRCFPRVPTCGPDETIDEEWKCIPAGVVDCGEAFSPDGHGGCTPILPEPCAPGTFATPGDTACREVGPKDCAPGFERDKLGECAAVLPPGECPAGEMAIPGDTACHAIAPCDEAPAGDLHVDAAAAIGGDGSLAKPFKTVVDAIGAAKDGDVIAIETGDYSESFTTAKAITLRGRCPAKVSIATDGIVFEGNGNLERLSLTGDLSPTFLLHTKATSTIDRVRIHGGGIGAWADSGTLTITASGIDGSEVGVQAQTGGKLVIDGSRISQLKERDGDTAAYGVLMGDKPSSLKLTRSVVSDARAAGILALGGTAIVTGSVVRDIRPDDYEQGVGIDSDSIAKVTVDHSLVEHTRNFGIRSVDGADLTIVDTTIRDIDGSGDKAGAAIHATDPKRKDLHVVVERVLIARNVGFGIQISGGNLAVRSTRIVDAKPLGKSDTIAGIAAMRNAMTTKPQVVTIEDSSFERMMEAIAVTGDATITRVSVTDVDYGITVGGLDPRSTMTVTRARVERAHEAGIRVFESDATVEDTLIREVKGGTIDGHGVSAFGNQLGSNLTVRRSLIASCQSTGVFAVGGSATVENVTFTDFPGRIFEVDGDTMPVLAATAILRHAHATSSAQHGLFFAGDVDATIEDVLLRDTGAQGVNAQDGARVSLARTRVDGAAGSGLLAIDASLTIDACLVTNSKTDADGAFGDGISVADALATGSLAITRTVVRDMPRAGLSVFGSTAKIQGSRFLCTAFDLDAEPSFATGASPDFVDEGDNVCGCGAPDSCRAASAQLTASPSAKPAPKPKKP
ncbi:MAG: right-handed parallel beta-helix repeat-containing protein [Polyangiales bacterium]